MAYGSHLRRRWPRWFAGSWIVAALAGCLLPDLGAYSGGVPDATTGDASLDAVTDVTDAAIVDAPAKRFCELYDGGTDATFCEDMDLPTSLTGPQWVVTDAGRFSDAAKSPPRSYEVDFDGQAVCSYASAGWTYVGPARPGVHIEADVEMLGTHGDGSETYFMAVGFKGAGNATCYAIVASQTAPVALNGASGDYLRLQNLTNGNVEVAFGYGANWFAGQPPEAGTFRRVVFDYDTSKSVPPSLVFDGKPGSVAFTDSGTMPCAGMSFSFVRIGLHCGANNAFHFRYDNLVVTPK